MSEVRIEGVMAGWSEYENKFADIIIEFVKAKCEDHRRPLKSVKLSARNLSQSYCERLKSIYRERQGRVFDPDSKRIATEMLSLFYWKCELDTTPNSSTYTLNKDGELYKLLEEMLTD